MRAGAQHRVAEPLGLALANEVNVGEVGRLDHPLQSRVIALVFELLFKLGHCVKMVRDRVLVAADDHEDVVDARGSRLFNDVLNRRLVDHRQHLFWHCLRRWEEARTKASGGNNGFHSLRRHAIHPSECHPPRRRT